MPCTTSLGEDQEERRRSRNHLSLQLMNRGQRRGRGLEVHEAVALAPIGGLVQDRLGRDDLTVPDQEEV